MTTNSSNQTNPWLKYQHTSLDPDHDLGALRIFSSHIGNQRAELPLHKHRNGQLIFVHKGLVTCSVDTGYWLVPAQSAMWIPATTLHSNRASANAFLSYAFIGPEVASLPCQPQLLAISPWIRELILHLANEPYPYENHALNHKMAQLLLQGLTQSKPLHFYAPLPTEPRLKKMAHAILQHPAQRLRLSDWAQQFSCSPRTLARHIQHHTGMGFSRWRQQLLVLLAMQQLGQGHAIKHIAVDLGYESPSAFIALFKQIIGVTPRQFSQQHLLHSPINKRPL